MNAEKKPRWNLFSTLPRKNNRSNEKISERIGGLLKGTKAARIAVIAGLSGILLIFLSQYIPSGEKESAEKSQKTGLSEYASLIEQRLTETAEKITGCECHVMLTMEQGSEFVYAADNKAESDYSENSAHSEYDKKETAKSEGTHVLVENNGDEQALVVTEIAPRVKGVVIVCTTSDKSRTGAVRAAASTVLNISEDRVCVVGGTEP